ncbi:hypothetical protein AN1V17_49960 [Vallitalea sediminicola]
MDRSNNKVNLEKLNNLRKTLDNNNYGHNNKLEEVLKISKELDDYILMIQNRLRNDKSK